MRRRGYHLRVFALMWAVLQFALPAFATAADARLAEASTGQAHVEEGPGANCAPSHSPDCAVCKHLSSSSLGTTHVQTFGVTDRRAGIAPRRVDPPTRTTQGVALPRGPPRDS